MNFLLHFHLASRDLGTPAAGAGAMLPDLWRMADRRVRPRRGGLDAGEAEGVLAAILAGIEHHLEVDRWFHKDAVFLEGEERTVRALREAGVQAPRIGLFAHVLWELCLDGELLRRQGLWALIGGLREGFAALDQGAGERAAALHHFDQVGRAAEERALFSHRLGRIGEEIRRGPWIDGYQSGEGIAFRIQGVRSRFGLPAMEWDDHLRLAEVAGGLLDEAPIYVDRILARPPAQGTLTAR